MNIDKFLTASPLFQAYLLHEKVMVSFQKYLKVQHLTFIQSMILTTIYFEEKQVTPNDLATALQTTPSNISHALNHLHQMRWITRSPFDSDLRKKTITLTATGSKKTLKLIKIYNTIQEHFENVVGEKPLAAWNKKARHLAETFSLDII